ncbi:hypothetical protein CSPX01_04383 [Colletotrichum filicis]|nr:hypothetical protein CSPX01_04383 [Colletotrichum filicis]
MILCPNVGWQNRPRSTQRTTRRLFNPFRMG